MYRVKVWGNTLVKSPVGRVWVHVVEGIYVFCWISLRLRYLRVRSIRGTMVRGIWVGAEEEWIGEGMGGRVKEWVDERMAELRSVEGAMWGD